METKKIQAKFAKMAKIIGYVIYFYIGLLFFVLVAGAITFAYIIDGNFSLFFSDLINTIMFFAILFAICTYFGLILFFLHSLKKLLISLRVGEIFTEKNKIHIKKLFGIFTILLLILFSVFSGGILLLFVLVFLWVLYEIFFIGFDYKKQKDKLEEENNLTI